MTIYDFILRLVAAILLGGAVGFERQWRQKSAGLRTNTLVSTGAAAYILLSLFINEGMGGDPSRVAAQVVTGIGFLGAGVIMKDGFSVQGLNTAATIWCSAAVGSLAGVGLMLEASIVTAAIILIHLLLRPISIRLSKVSPYVRNELSETEYVVAVRCKQRVESRIRILLLQYFTSDERLLLKSLASSMDEEKEVTIKAVVLAVGEQDFSMEKLVGRLTLELDVTRASWEIVGQQGDL